MFNTNKRETHVMERCLPSPKWICIINAFLLLLHVSVAKTLEPINWDKLVFVRHPGGLAINASINDVVDVICPKSALGEEQQFHTFTQVTKQGYERCILSLGQPQGLPKTLLQCNRPALVNELRLLFQEQTSFPGDPTFKHGRDYYFITTADGTPDGINQPTGGLCVSHNMKLKIHVNGDAVTEHPWSSTQSTPIQRTAPSRPTPLRRTPTLRTTTQPTTAVKPTRRKTTEKMPDKSSENDSLTGDDGNHSSTLCPSSLLLLLSCTAAFVRWLRW